MSSCFTQGLGATIQGMAKGAPRPGGGGNAHDRAIARGAEEGSKQTSASIIQPQMQPEQPERRPALSRRMVAFVEQPLFLLPCGIIGGAVGLLIYTPAILITAACFVGAFHRTEVVKGYSRKVQAPAYFGIFAIAFAFGYGAVFVGKQAARKAMNELVSEIKSEPTDQTPKLTFSAEF